MDLLPWMKITSHFLNHIVLAAGREAAAHSAVTAEKRWSFTLLWTTVSCSTSVETLCFSLLQGGKLHVEAKVAGSGPHLAGPHKLRPVGIIPGCYHGGRL